jgi:predicted PurR-regulated permease PerM
MAKTEGSGRGRVLEDFGAWVHLHLWQIQPIRDLLLLAAIFGILWAAYTASVVTVPVLLALALAYLFEPVVRRFSKGNRVRRRIAAGGIILAVLVLVVVPLTFGLIWAVTSGLNMASGLQQNLVTLRTVVNQKSPPTPEQLDALPNEAWQEFAVFLREPRGGSSIPAGEPAPESGSGQSSADGATDTEAAGDGPDDGDAKPVAEGSDEGSSEEAPKDSSDEMSEDESEGSSEEKPDSLAEEMIDEGLAAAMGTGLTTGGVPSLRGMMRAGAEWAWHWAEANQDKLKATAAQKGRVALAFLFRGTKSVGLIVFTGFLTAFFFFFICTGYQRVLHSLRDLIPDKVRPRALHLFQRMDRVIAGFVRGRLTISLILSVLFTIGYTIIGTPLPLLLGLATGILSIVPYLALITVPPAIILMFLGPAEGIRGAWWWSLFAPIVLYYTVQSMDDYVLTPRIQGKQTDMDMPSILFASFAGAALFGVFGLLIAIPLAACIKILWIEVALPRIAEWKKGRAADPLPIAEAPAAKT